MEKVRIKTRYTESFEIDVPVGADHGQVKDLRNALLDFCVKKTGADRFEMEAEIVFDSDNNKLTFICSETIIG